MAAVSSPHAHPEWIGRGEGGPYRPEGRSPWLDVDWRAQQRWVELSGGPVNVIELGEDRSRTGQAVLFVHGLSGSWQNWLEQLPVIGREHRVIALDLPGFGASPMPSRAGGISISAYGRILEELLEHLGVSAAAVVGNSMGGFIATELAIAFPPRVERLVLVSAAGLSTRTQLNGSGGVDAVVRAQRLLAATGAWLASRSEEVTRRPRLREATLGMVVAHPRLVPAELAAEQLRGAGKQGFIEALLAIRDYDVRERLPEIACPTLIVWGERDRLITVRDADLFATLIPNSRKVIFEDTGHVAMLERPAVFNRLLLEFLVEPPALTR